MSFFHNHLGKLSSYENMKGKKAQGQSFKRGNDSTEIIFYDKSQQLRDSGVPVEGGISILRMELKLKNRKKIQYAFKSCFWKDLCQEKINGYFRKQIYEQLLKKFNNWQKTREKELKKLILDCRAKSSKVWHHLLMQEIRNKSELEMIPYILDIEQVCNAYKKLPDPYRNANRSLKALLGIPIENDSYKNKDIAKVYEILETLENYLKETSNFPQ